MNFIFICVVIISFSSENKTFLFIKSLTVNDTEQPDAGSVTLGVKTG